MENLKMKLYSCTTCKILLPLTEEYFFACLIKRGHEDPNRSTVGKCKTCAIEYAKNYRESLIQKKLTRKNKPAQYNNRGLLYIIGTTPDNPIKIGITTGNSIKVRLSGLQTSHWLELKILFQSNVIENLRDVEAELHKTYKQYNVRGEWFDMPQGELKKLILKLRKKFQKCAAGPRK